MGKRKIRKFATQRSTGSKIIFVFYLRRKGRKIESDIDEVNMRLVLMLKIDMPRLK